MRTFQIISVSHTSHTAKERIELDLTEDLWNQLYSYMKFDLQVEGYVHISTCNRIEIYYEADGDRRFQIIEKWISLNASIETIDVSRIKTFIGNNICNRYLLSLSIGLFSAIAGDDQIIAQLKKAFTESRNRGNLSTLLERSFQSIMKAHKQICNETDYRKQVVSLAYHSLKSIYRAVPKADLVLKRILIIGAGDMAAQILKYIHRFNFGHVAISNRTKSKAVDLVLGKRIDVVEYCDINGNDFNIIISCTDHGYDVINHFDKLDYYIDLSLRSTRLPSLDIPHILLPELQYYIQSQNEKRFSSLGVVKRIIGEHARAFSDWVVQWESRQKSESINIY